MKESRNDSELFESITKTKGSRKVKKRTYYQKSQHQSESSIKVIGVAADGDSRLLSSIKQKAVNLKFNPLNLDEYFPINRNELTYFQDPIHIGTKLRNLLLKISVCLPFGNSVISISHLKFLISKVSKDKHGLTESDILPYDHQNYRSLEKIMEDRVIQFLDRKQPLYT